MLNSNYPISQPIRCIIYFSIFDFIVTYRGIKFDAYTVKELDQLRKKNVYTFS